MVSSGIYVPKELIEKAGPSLALKISAFHIGEYTFTNPEQNRAVQLGLLKMVKFSQEEIVSIIKRKKPQHLHIDLSKLRICEWCKATTVILHSHHYPLPRAQGGKKIVNICPNCHCEFHKLESDYLFSLIDPYASEINEYFNYKGGVSCP